MPTKNEAANIEPLLQRIAQASQGINLEVIFVDDSTDNTAQVVQTVSKQFPFDITVLGAHQNGVMGWARPSSKASVSPAPSGYVSWIVISQHPPEAIPQLLERAFSTGANLVVASRLTAGGGTTGLSFRRKLISHVLALASHLCFPRRLRQVTDPNDWVLLGAGAT